MRRRVVLTAAFFVLLSGWLILQGLPRSDRGGLASIACQFEDRSLFLSAIKRMNEPPGKGNVTGITVPHHLLAADLIAKAFNYSSKGKYSRILVLSPDHFNLGSTNISTTSKSFCTGFGVIASDAGTANELKKLPFVRERDFFYREHGVQAILPFIKYYFPGSKVIVLTFKNSTPKAQLDELVDTSEKTLPQDTLIVQSTDFSHYLTPEQAKEHDGRTISIIKECSAEGTFSLKQPDDIDSIPCQYIQTRLQNELLGSKPVLLAHKNSQDYTKEKVSSSTSYLVHAYVARTASLLFVGDIMLSRYVDASMRKRNDYSFPFSKIKELLNSADLAFGNLEGPLTDKGKRSEAVILPPNSEVKYIPGPFYLRADPKVVKGLKKAGFDILCISNNHIWDSGKAGFLDSLKHLKDAGLAFVGGGADKEKAHKGIVKNINGNKVAFLAYTNLLPRSRSILSSTPGICFLNIDRMKNDIKKAKSTADIVIISVHWGQEYQTKHNAFQEKLAKAAIDSGATLIIGHHPHVVQEVERYKDGWIAYSLGNFIFDQTFSEETRKGLALRVNIKNGTIVDIEKITISIGNDFRAFVSN